MEYVTRCTKKIDRHEYQIIISAFERELSDTFIFSWIFLRGQKSFHLIFKSIRGINMKCTRYIAYLS